MNNQTLALTQEQRQVQTLAPQLRQSLEILQVPALELRALIQKELLQNPVLEEKSEDSIALDQQDKKEPPEDIKELNFKEEFDILTRLDKDDYAYYRREYDPYDPDSEKRRSYALDVKAREESLQEHLANQLAYLKLSERDHRIGELIIGNINEDGYLTQSIEDIAASAGYEPGYLHDILALIQDFDPVGVGACNLKECLLIQLQRLGHDSSLAAKIVGTHLDHLASKKYPEIAGALNVTVEEVHQAAKVISALDPRPGVVFGSETPPYVFPDVFVEKGENGYQIVINNSQVPRLRISKHYRQLMADEHSSEEVKNYIKEKIKSSLFIIKSIGQRQQTIRRVASEIVNVQTEFFDSGVAHLKPLTMSDVAKRVGLHETTVCRCVANKYMNTPSGVFEMKYFFTPGLKTNNGQTVSNKAVQDMIAGIVAEEEPGHPLSDQEIFERLNAKGLQIARRTVAKYRMALKIPPSHMRKSG